MIEYKVGQVLRRISPQYGGPEEVTIYAIRNSVGKDPITYIYTIDKDKKTYTDSIDMLEGIYKIYDPFIQILI